LGTYLYESLLTTINFELLNLNPIKDGLFGAPHGWGGHYGPPPSIIPGKMIIFA